MLPSSPPPYPHYLCYRYFCRYSCAISGVYNSVVRLMPDISSHFSDNYRQTSGGHLPRVGFPCFLELTGNLAANFFCEKLNYTSRLKTSEINFIALSLSSISFGSKVSDKPGIDLTSFDEYELLLEVNPDTS